MKKFRLFGQRSPRNDAFCVLFFFVPRKVEKKYGAAPFSFLLGVSSCVSLSLSFFVLGRLWTDKKDKKDEKKDQKNKKKQKSKERKKRRRGAFRPHKKRIIITFESSRLHHHRIRRRKKSEERKVVVDRRNGRERERETHTERENYK